MKQYLYKIIYSPVINKIIRGLIKPFSYAAPGFFKIPPTGRLTFKLKEGKEFKLETNQTSYLTKVIYWKGINSFEYTKLFNDLIKNCKVFFDIGANIGYYSIMAATSSRTVNIFSFEPAEGPQKYLESNIRINGFQDRIMNNNLALSNEAGKITFYEVNNEKYSYLKYNLSGVGNAEGIKHDRKMSEYEVPSNRLDNYVNENNIHGIDIIKIDTEGTEYLILEGARESIIKYKPIIICETLFNKIEAKLEELIKSFGYQFFNHSNNELYLVDTIIRKEDDGIRDCFFVHPEKYHLIEKYVHTDKES